MKILFYFGHPAKFHFLRNTINKLLDEGNEVNVFINSKDILEELVQSEGWNYKNLFPKGRRIKYFNTTLNIYINSVITIIKLFCSVIGKKYNLFVTSDLLVVVGKMLRIPSILITDDDISAVPQQWVLFKFADHIFAPEICNIGSFEFKKIGFKGYKAIAHLHPKVFSPSMEVVKKYSLEPGKYFLIRTVSVTSYHDVGHTGINDDLLIRIVKFLEKFGRVILNSERKTCPELRKYDLNFAKKDFAHILAYSRLFVSDSSTVCAEATVLGVQAIEFNSWFHLYAQPTELSKSGLIYYTNDESKLFTRLVELLDDISLPNKTLELKNIFLERQINISDYLYWLITNYPKSIQTLTYDPTFYNKYE